MGDISRGALTVSGFLDPEMDFQLIRQLGSAPYGGASLGPILNITNQHPDITPATWVSSFHLLAKKQEENATACLQKKHGVSAREAFLEAANLYRAAEYFASCSDPLHFTLGKKSTACFLEAMHLMTEWQCESYMLPYKNITIPAYFFAPKKDGKKRKTILIVSGFDGTIEEEFLMRGIAGLTRDFNVIHFAGPGQMDVFRNHPEQGFEPDFENVVSTVIDHFKNRSDIDMDHLALLGLSVGGYFATRAASREPRIKYLIANSPVLDVCAYFSAFLGFDPMMMPDEHDFTLDDIPHIPDAELSKELKSRCEQMMIRYGRRSFKKTFEYMNSFVVGDAIHNISKKSLGMAGSAEGVEPLRQYQEFLAKTSATGILFTDEDGASMHCQTGNVRYANAVMYDWLVETQR